MNSTGSWAWYPGTLWPGFTPSSQDNIGTAGNGLTIDPASLTLIQFNDANADGTIFDDDTDDTSRANGDSVTVGGSDRTVLEVGRFVGSTFVHNGTTYTVPMVVWVFTDGTYMVRVNDADIPDGHYSRTETLRLGSFDGQEYDGTFIATRDDGFFCFAAGTLIGTPDGTQSVERLQPGDLVLTLDHGPQPVRWVGRRMVSGVGPGEPVLFGPGAVGNSRALRVSPNHRMLLASPQVELLFGEPAVLAYAKHLVDGVQVLRAPVARVTWVHILLDRHEIVFAEDAPCESFHPGAVSRGGLDHAVRDEIARFFPELDAGAVLAGAMALPCLTRWEAALVAGSAWRTNGPPLRAAAAVTP